MNILLESDLHFLGERLFVTGRGCVRKKKTWVDYRLLKRKSISRNECNSQRMDFGPFWKINKMTQLIRIETNQEQSFFFF